MTTPHVHLVWPVRIDAGRFAVAPEGSTGDLASQVALCVATRPGDRAAVPAFGLADPTGQRRLDTTNVEQTVDRWVPAARTAGVTAVIDDDGVATVVVPTGGD